MTGTREPLSQAQVDELRRRAERVRATIKLSDLIGLDVKLTRRGGEWLGLCPFHVDGKLGSFSVNDTKEVFKCFSCGAGGDHFKYLQLRKGMPFMQALRALESDAGIDFRTARSDPKWEHLRQKRMQEAARDGERRRRSAENMWLSAPKLQATPAELYLRGRGIDFGKLGRFPGSLRCRSGCSYPEVERPFVAMLAKMQTPDGVHRATHRTFLDYGAPIDGVGGWGKARVDGPPKLTLGDYAGAAIVLSKGEHGCQLKDLPEGAPVAISEGIEDGLSVALGDPSLFVLAAACLDNIGGVALPAQVSDVLIIGQRDKPGSAADAGIERQIGRLQARGLTVACMWPEPGFKDFNDQLRGIRMPGVAA